MSDLISRQAAIDAASEIVFVEYEDGDPRKEESIILQTKAAIRDRIKALPPVYVPDMNVGKWNPVSERLPETSEDILILLDDYKNMSVGRYYAADGEWYADFGEGPFDGVVAWMPLPEPMKKVSLEPWEGEADGQK